ncbi:MAG: TlpA family protein disulfide reductase [Bryobacteraceae bacterium]|nr:TlpA family protein disulfide reductase [Bryobacteraceae bacterium]MCX7604109.1 TlpA family protein disulfide reductase [Bryobacteraceae bacterium]
MSKPVAAIFLLAASLVHGADLQPLDEAGYQRLLASAKGRVLVVNFWATWCAPCRKEMPELVALASKYRARGLQFVTVAIDEESDAPKAAEFVTKTKVPQPAYIKRFQNDEKFISMVDPKWSGGLPFTVVYDRAGKKVRVFPGEVDIRELEQVILKAL